MFITSAKKFLEQRQEIPESSTDSRISPQKEHPGDGIISIVLKKIVTRHLLNNLYWSFRDFVSKEVRNDNQ